MQGRHNLELVFTDCMSDDEKEYITTHEMGHIFGLEHEHQHPDRKTLFPSSLFLPLSVLTKPLYRCFFPYLLTSP